MREKQDIYGALKLAKIIKIECDNDIHENYWMGLIVGLKFCLGE